LATTYAVEVPYDPLSSVDILIKAFMRPDCVRRLVDSILERYPRATLNIADDSELDENTRGYYAALQRMGHQVLLLPFNVGTSAGRNALVDHTNRPYVLLLDDDFVFTERTRIETLVDVLAADASLGVAAGSVLDEGTTLRSYEYNLRVKGGFVHYYPLVGHSRDVGGHTCRDADIVLNFALFRREVFASTRWDDALKQTEHTDFFLRLAQTPWRVVHVPGVLVDHYPEMPRGYENFRYNPENESRLGAKWKVVGPLFHVEDPRRDRRRVRRIYGKAVLRACRQRQLGMATRLAVSASIEEARRVSERAVPLMRGRG
jgi:GT2 family glycosyltransferase